MKPVVVTWVTVAEQTLAPPVMAISRVPVTLEPPLACAWSDHVSAVAPSAVPEAA
jgi:hypothetical protein